MSEIKQTVSLIGNPNCGKTTLFNALTGSKQRVGNWPGVTVDKKTGHFATENGQHIDVIDLPGTYAIESLQEDVSQDELIVRNFVLTDKDSVLINIIDASNLQRNLYLTFQLLDLNRPMIVVLNMMDVAKLAGCEIYVSLLQERLGCPVVPITANKGTGITELKKVIASYDVANFQPRSLSTLSQTTEASIRECFQKLPDSSVLHQASRWLQVEAIMGVYNALVLTEEDIAVLQTCRDELAVHADGEVDIALASSRYEAIDALSRQVIKTVGLASTELTNKLDKWALGRVTGIPIFLLVMFVMFVLAINVGSAFIDFFDILFGAIFVEGTTHLLESINAPAWIIAILANGIGAGIQTVSTFIPVIAGMFLCLSFLEDSGYLARAAMVVDRGMRAIGLPGKAFVPMLVGFGCNIPAIMGTRTLESHRDRLMSIMMIPFMSCGARLPVYALFAAVFFPRNGGIVVYALYLFGILIAILTGFALKHSILKGANTPFIMELPSYHLPTVKGILLLTWDRLKGFIYRAGRAIIIVVALLGVLNTVGSDGSFGNQDTDKSVLSGIGRSITPVFEPMGLTEENWPATVGIFTGIFAKEAVIGTLNSLYTQMDATSAAEGGEEKSFDLWVSAKEALATIPENLKGIPGGLLDPLGIGGTLAGGDLSTVQEDNAIDDAAVTHIQQLFGSSAAVIAYMIFILLYTPCVAALGAVYREAGTKWTFMVAAWTFILGWICATGYYQLSLLGTEKGGGAMAWLIALVVIIVSLFLLLRLFGKKDILADSKKIISASHLKNNSKGSCC